MSDRNVSPVTWRALADALTAAKPTIKPVVETAKAMDAWLRERGFRIVATWAPPDVDLVIMPASRYQEECEDYDRMWAFIEQVASEASRPHLAEKARELTGQ